MCGNSQNVQIKQALFGTQTFGVMITDPPFGINYQSNMDGSLPRSIAGDKDTVARDSALLSVDEAFPVACFATWHCAPPRKPRGMLIWKKNVGGMGDLSFPWSLDYEVIWIFGKGWKGHRGSSVLEGETIVTWNTGPAKRLHPHQKPVQVLTQIIEKSQGVVFDPFLGSGSTLLACQQLGKT
jgi:site-specific DNA-methyltransferase (adenine-specific)